MDLLITMMFRVAVFIFVISSVGLMVFLGLYLNRRRSGSQVMAGSLNSRSSQPRQVSLLSYLGEPEEKANQVEKPLPNGWRRQDYHEFGISDGDIDYWGLDQPGAPEPYSAGIMIAQMKTESEMDDSQNWDRY